MAGEIARPEIALRIARGLRPGVMVVGFMVDAIVVGSCGGTKVSTGPWGNAGHEREPAEHPIMEDAVALARTVVLY